jgi:hypothetical protein
MRQLPGIILNQKSKTGSATFVMIARASRLQTQSAMRKAKPENTAAKGLLSPHRAQRRLQPV